MRRIDHFGFSACIETNVSRRQVCENVILSGREPFPEIQLYAAALHIRYNLFRYRRTGTVHSQQLGTRDVNDYN